MNMLTRNLDDRTFDDLLSEGLSRLPTVAPEWTNHNPSDPGITLIELLAYFTEILVYRLGRITPASKLQFLKLLKGANWEGLTQPDDKVRFLRLLMGARWEGWKALDPARLEREIDCAVLTAGPNEMENAIDYLIHDLKQNECAVTAHDFEQIANRAARNHLGSKGSIRTLCVPSINLEKAQPGPTIPADSAHVSIVVVPGQELPDDAITSVCEKIRNDLLPHCLLTTRIHVVAPIYLNLAIGLKLAPKAGWSTQELSDALRGALQQRFGLEPGQGPQGAGWPFGKALHISELVEAVEETPGVDYVDDVTILQISAQERKVNLPGSALGVQIGIHSTLGHDALLGGPDALGSGRLLRNDAGRLVSIALRPWELLRVNVATENISTIETQGTGDAR
jgi:hypothetical protein